MNPENWLIHLLGIGLMLAGGGMMWAQRALWDRLAQRRNVAPAERDFRQRQMRRRWVIAVIVVMLGTMIVAGEYIELLPLPAWAHIVYWSLAALACLWLAALALADMLAVWRFYGRLRDRYELEQLKLRVQARRLEQEIARSAAESDEQSNNRSDNDGSDGNGGSE